MDLHKSHFPLLRANWLLIRTGGRIETPITVFGSILLLLFALLSSTMAHNPPFPIEDDASDIRQMPQPDLISPWATYTPNPYNPEANYLYASSSSEPYHVGLQAAYQQGASWLPHHDLSFNPPAPTYEGYQTQPFPLPQVQQPIPHIFVQSPTPPYQPAYPPHPGAQAEQAMAGPSSMQLPRTPVNYFSDRQLEWNNSWTEQDIGQALTQALTRTDPSLQPNTPVFAAASSFHSSPSPIAADFGSATVIDGDFVSQPSAHASGKLHAQARSLSDGVDRDWQVKEGAEEVVGDLMGDETVETSTRQRRKSPRKGKPWLGVCTHRLKVKLSRHWEICSDNPARNASNGKLRCNVCGDLFSGGRQDNLNVHMRRKHPGGS